LEALRAAWLPKITKGWFFRAESFFSVARYLDAVGSPSDFLSYSHGEGFLRFFEERCQKQGIFIFDEPEAALSPARQLVFVCLMRRWEEEGNVQAIIATHAPILMAYPGVRLLEFRRGRIREVEFEETEHYQVMRNFFADPRGYLEGIIAGKE
jgi:predicted ATPase